MFGDFSLALCWWHQETAVHRGGEVHGACTGIPISPPPPESRQPCRGLGAVLSLGVQRLRREGDICVWGKFGEERPTAPGARLCDFSLFPIGHGRDQGVSPRKRAVAEISRSRHGNDHNQGWEVSWPPLWRAWGICGGDGEGKVSRRPKRRRPREGRGAKKGENRIEERERMNVFCLT